MSYIIILVVAVYAGFKLKETLRREGPDINKMSSIRLPEEEEPYRPQDGGFDFAFSLLNSLDPSIGYFVINFINQSLPGEGLPLVKSKTPLPIKPCGTENFNYDNKQEIRYYGIDKFQCLANDSYSLRGNFYS